MSTTRLLALGNVLIGDDAFGPYLMAALHAHWKFPPGVELVDAGTPGFDLLPMIEDAENLIILDSVTGPGPPGTVTVSNRECIVGGELRQRGGPHDPSLRAVLLEAEMREIGPSVIYLVGVVPENIRAGTSLTRKVRAAVPLAEIEVLTVLRKLGIHPRFRQPPQPIQVWWEEALPGNA